MWAGPWTLTSPEPMAELNLSHGDKVEPFLSPDGLTILLQRGPGQRSLREPDRKPSNARLRFLRSRPEHAAQQQSRRGLALLLERRRAHSLCGGRMARKLGGLGHLAGPTPRSLTRLWPVLKPASAQQCYRRMGPVAFLGRTSPVLHRPGFDPGHFAPRLFGAAEPLFRLLRSGRGAGHRHSDLVRRESVAQPR